MLSFYAQEQYNDSIVEAQEIDSIIEAKSPENIDNLGQLQPIEGIEYKAKTNDSPIQITDFQDIDKKYNDDDFSYDEKSNKTSFFGRFLNNFYKFLEAIADFFFGKASEEQDYIERIIKIFLFLVALFIVIKLIIKHKGRWFFDRTNKKIDIPIEEIEKHIHEVDFQKMIKQSENQNDTRQSIRLYYLWLLKVLSDKKIIEWNVRKTNSDYAREIKNNKQKADFVQLSKIYNYIWYGEFTINDVQYQQAKHDFQNYINTQKIK